MSIQETIREINFFNNLNEEQIDLIASISSVSKYPDNSILYYESDENKNLLFLVEGLIKIYKVDKFDNEIFLYHIYKNTMISELTSIKDSSIYCFSNAGFIEDSTVLSINFEKFKTNLNEKLQRTFDLT